MKRKIVVAIMLIICFVLQCTVFKALAFASISPNLLIILTSAFGFMGGKKEGMYIGFFSGLLLDIFYGNVIGFYALMYLLIGYTNGFFRKIFYPEDIKLPMMLISASDLICNMLVYFFLFLFRGQFSFPYYLVHIITPELVYTILVTIFLYPLVLKTSQVLELAEKKEHK